MKHMTLSGESSLKKRESASSMFMKRGCSPREHTLRSERIADALANICSTIIKFKYCTERWMRVSCIMVEKGKGPMTKKLIILVMIEVYAQLIV